MNRIDLKQQIANKVALNTIVTNENIYEVINLATYNDNNGYEIIEQLDRAKCKVSLENRLKAILELIADNFNSYIYTRNEFGEWIFNESSNLVMLYLNNYVHRFGLEKFINDANVQFSYLTDFVVVNFSDYLDQYLINYNLNAVDKWRTNNEANLNFTAKKCLTNTTLTDNLQIILRKYKAVL